MAKEPFVHSICAELFERSCPVLLSLMRAPEATAQAVTFDKHGVINIMQSAPTPARTKEDRLDRLQRLRRQGVRAEEFTPAIPRT